jgi:hypothetical protein
VYGLSKQNIKDASGVLNASTTMYQGCFAGQAVISTRWHRPAWRDIRAPLRTATRFNQPKWAARTPLYGRMGVNYPERPLCPIKAAMLIAAA